MLLKELTSINGVSGDEERVRDFIKQQVISLADEIKVDKLGNLIAYKKGYSSGHTVMLSAHMDEVGFIITFIEEDGMLRFATVSGMDARMLPGKKVVIGENKVNGVIGTKPVHFIEKDERQKSIPLKELYIDIGASGRQEAEKLVKTGDYACFISEYTELGDSLVKSKALDDRAGCCALIEALKSRYEFDIYACFTVQEEVGLKGAEAAAFRIKPDIALVIESTTCSDVPGVEEYDYSTVMNEGPALTIMDRTSYPDRNLVDYIYRTAVTYGIKLQYKQTVTGGNDAGKIQRSAGGVKTAVISVPCRYIHSPASVMSLKDYYGLIKLLGAVLDGFGREKDLFEKIIDGRKIDA